MGTSIINASISQIIKIAYLPFNTYSHTSAVHFYKEIGGHFPQKKGQTGVRGVIGMFVERTKLSNFFFGAFL